MFYDLCSLRQFPVFPTPELCEGFEGVDDDRAEADHGGHPGRSVLVLDEEVDGGRQVEQGEDSTGNALHDQHPSGGLDGVNGVQHKDDSWADGELCIFLDW